MQRVSQCMPKEGAALVFERTASFLSQASSGQSAAFSQQAAAVQTLPQQEALLWGFDFYLGIKGEFRCMQSCFVPGLSAGEYFSTGSVIRFQPGQNAFLAETDAAQSGQAPAPQQRIALAPALPEERSQVTVSWLQVQGEYYLSSAGGSFYTWQDGVFRPMALLAAQPDSESGCFPVMPWLYVQLEEAGEGRRAEALLSAQRRKILMDTPGQGALRAGGGQGREEIAVTPDGICIGISDKGRVFHWIGLGNVSGGDRPDIRLSGDLSLARQKFLEEECFLIISSAKELASYGGAEGISVPADGWRISLPKDQWEEKGVLAVLKYNQSFSIAQKLDGHPVFKELMERAYKDGEEAEGFHEFLRAVTDKAFQGFVLFNAVVSAEGISQAAKEIVSGITDLRAVYTAVNSSKITAENGNIRIGTSAVAAFICYQQDHAAASGECFKTTGLSVQILGSEMVSFLSRSELFLQKLLGETCGCCLVLNGTMEQDSAGNGSCRFYLDSQVCCSISGSAVQSIQVDAVHMSVEKGAKLFALNGRISFTELEEGDLFSYESLFFENLCLSIEGRKQEITEHLSGLRFVAADSAVRKNSLAETFGASAGQYYTDMQEEPDSLGFCSVNTPVGQAELEKGWNGIVYSIPIGSDGQLGSGAQLRLDMLLAWSGDAYYFGVKKSSLDVMTLSGVLGFGFGGIEILKEEDSFLIRFCSIGIRLFQFTIPKNSADLYVFGKAGKTGWYMGYGEEEE